MHVGPTSDDTKLLLPPDMDLDIECVKLASGWYGEL